MASVYVSGDDEKSLVQFSDNNEDHDHSYYGMGCPNSWGTEGLGGSDIPCSATGRIVKDGTNDEQKNGTYFNFQAATSGTGGSISTNNANSSDTFCPLGWQLPYSGTGGDYYDKSKSWNYLLEIYNIKNSASGATSLKTYPFTYVYSGRYLWKTGRLYNQNIGSGFFQSSTSVAKTSSYSLITNASTVNTIYSDIKTWGYTIRCSCKKQPRKLPMASAFTH